MAESETYYPIVEKLGSPVSITYNAQDNWVYWTDAMEHEEAIWRARLNGSDIEAVVTSGVSTVYVSHKCILYFNI